MRRRVRPPDSAYRTHPPAATVGTNRRGLLLAAGGAALSGCLRSEADGGGSRSPGPTNHLGDFVLWNDDEPHTISLTVERDGETLAESRRTLEPDTSTRVPNPVEHRGTHRVVALETSTREGVEWEIASGHSYEYRQIHVDDDAGIEIRAMRRTVDPTPPCG